MASKPLHVLFGRPKKLLETSKKEKQASSFLGYSYFIFGYISAKKGSGHRACTRGLVFYVEGWVRVCVGEGIRALRAGCIPSPEPKPASGLGDSASMLSPKGDHDREVGRASDLWGLDREAMGKGKDGSGKVSHFRAGRA